MADAQLIEEELQQSVRLSQESATQTEDMADSDAMGDALALESSRADGSFADQDVEGEDEDEDQQVYFGDDGAEIDEDSGGCGSDDGEEDGDAEGDQDGVFHGSDDEEEDGDLDQHAGSRNLYVGEGTPSTEQDEVEDEDDDDDEDEGVGAVKIRPGETEDEEESEEDASSHGGSSAAESASDGAWDDEAAEAEDDEGSEHHDTDLCMFCKWSEDHKHGKGFETFITCRSCSEFGTLQSQLLLNETNGKQPTHSALGTPMPLARSKVRGSRELGGRVPANNPQALTSGTVLNVLGRPMTKVKEAMSKTSSTNVGCGRSSTELRMLTRSVLLDGPAHPNSRVIFCLRKKGRSGRTHTPSSTSW